MKKIILNKSKKQIEKRSFDYFIIFIFIISMIMPIIVSTSQQYIVQYSDDVAVISWAKEHSIFDIFSSKIGTGYRPIMYLIYIINYTLWGSQAMYYYLFSGILFSGAMIFLYLLGKTLHSRLAGITSVALYLFLDASFILISKINFIVTIGEIFFITSALYFSIKYFKNTKDQNSKWMTIILSILAFLTKEPSLLIIPSFILTYLYFNNKIDKKYIILCLIPYFYIILEMIFISPDVGSGGANIFQRIIENGRFYIETEINSQFKTPILIGLVLLLSTYYFSYNNLKKEISVCVMWFVVGILPFLITQQPVQPTYLAEANLGMVLLMGIVISVASKKFNLITIILIAGIIMQILVIPTQISNTQNYTRMVGDNQNTFLEVVTELKNIPKDESIYYISEMTRAKHGGYQINEGFFEDYLCIRNMCDLRITTNYSEAKYIILPSSLDIQIFQKEYPNEKSLQVIKQIQHNNDYGFILKKE